ncbi:hypothetical protein AMECASPLE_008921 [Ameca splendens]|uniref:Alkylated DNA repair protein AlkB homologue 8 N-terminal domain-containing protein n=1 Tax=Ameca splendens TaxID=208324 RepID=A0ABV0YNF2_9TELE
MLVKLKDFFKHKSASGVKINSILRVSNIRFLGVYRTWTINTTTEFKKVQQRLFFLTMLKKTGLPQEMLITFYRWSVERIQHAASPHGKALLRIVSSAPSSQSWRISTTLDASGKLTASTMTILFHATTYLNCCHWQEVQSPPHTQTG